MSLRALDLRSRLARKTIQGQSVKGSGNKERKKPDAETQDASVEENAGERPIRQPRTSLKISAPTSPSETTDEAVDIVDQLLAGATPSREQLLVIKAELLRDQDMWLTEGDEQWLKDSLMQMVMSKLPREAAVIKSMPQGTTPAACYAPQLRSYFARAMHWEVPIWDIDRLSKGRPLSTIVMWICDELGLFDALGLEPVKMRMFALKVEQNYLDCPYHNKAHAATVTLMLFQIILHSGMVKQLKTDKIGDVPMTLYIFAAIIAASIHDLHHPGVGSDFRVRTADEASQRYHDQSVNENDHLGHGLGLMRETALLAGLHPEAQKIIRAVIINMVLKTDMCYHFEVMQKFKAVSARKVKSEEALLATLAMFLKCADLGHSALPWTEHLRWFRMLEEEYHQQGDMEKELGFSVSALTDRDKSMGPTQAKFFEALVIPMYRELCTEFPDTKALLEGVQANRNQWQACKGVVD